MKHTKELARWLATLKYSDLPANVVEFTKRYILDDLGCMVGCVTTLLCPVLTAVALREKHNPDPAGIKG